MSHWCTTGNEYRRRNPEILILFEVELYQMRQTFKRQNLEFLIAASSIEVCFSISTMIETRKWIYSWFGANIAISGYPLLSQSLPTFLPNSPCSKILDLSLEFDAICRSSGNISISGFGGHVTISGCQLSSVTVFELAVVDSPRFVIGKQHTHRSSRTHGGRFGPSATNVRKNRSATWG